MNHTLNITSNHTLNTLSNKHEKEYDDNRIHGLIFAIIICSPCICIFLYLLYYKIKQVLFSIYNYIKKKIIYCLEKKDISQTNNNELSKKYIQTLNKNNKSFIKENIINCPICFDNININNYNSRKLNITFLNCKHVYHTDCIQKWINQQIISSNNCSCPICRDIIIDIPIYADKNISYVSSDEESLSDWYD